MKVPIRKLKAKLSEYLRRTAQGEEVSITSHGKVIAYLTAARPREDEAALLARLKTQPWVTPGTREPIRGLKKGVVLRGKGPTAAQTVIQDRE